MATRANKIIALLIIDLIFFFIELIVGSSGLKRAVEVIHF